MASTDLQNDWKFNNQPSGKTCEGPAILPYWQVNQLACNGDENSLRAPGGKDQPHPPKIGR